MFKRKRMRGRLLAAVLAAGMILSLSGFRTLPAEADAAVTENETASGNVQAEEASAVTMPESGEENSTDTFAEAAAEEEPSAAAEADAPGETEPDISGEANAGDNASKDAGSDAAGTAGDNAADASVMPASAGSEQDYADAVKNGVTFTSCEVSSYADADDPGKAHLVLDAVFADDLKLNDRSEAAASFVPADGAAISGFDSAATQVFTDGNLLTVDLTADSVEDGIIALQGTVIGGLTAGEDDAVTYWPDDWSAIVPTGLSFALLSGTVGTASRPASVTVRVLNPVEIASEGYVLWTSDGSPLLAGAGTEQTAGLSLKPDMDTSAVAAAITSSAQDALASAGYQVSADGDTITVTAQTAKAGEYLGVYSYDETFLNTYGLSEKEPAEGLPADIGLADVEILPQPFSGEKLSPQVTVYFGGEELKEGTDYEVSVYETEDYVSVGSPYVEVSGLNGYEGTIDGQLQILFSDVTDSGLFYYDPVYWAAFSDITTGWSDGTFRPLNKCNRAAVVTFLWRLAGRPEPSAMATFSDMTGNSDFDKAISWAAEEGITTGWDDGTFRPWNTCNRAAIVTFLWRYAGKPGASESASFKDMTGNSDFDKAISWAAGEEITTGWDDGTFRPWNTCNRLAVASFLFRYEAEQ